ncbi:hypothetical protein [Nonomuraea rubra]|uniref:hypothetical protein n=1 Tax=Nonomuraea rubra TaxID=46180 RepID=UPI0031E8FB1A
MESRALPWCAAERPATDERGRAECSASRWARQCAPAAGPGAAIVWAGRIGLAAGAVAAWDLASGTLVRPFFVSTPSASRSGSPSGRSRRDFWFHARFTAHLDRARLPGGRHCSGCCVPGPLALLRRVAYRVVRAVLPHRVLGAGGGARAVFITLFGIGWPPKIVLAAYFVFFVVCHHTPSRGASGRCRRA